MFCIRVIQGIKKLRFLFGFNNFFGVTAGNALRCKMKKTEAIPRKNNS